MKPNVVPRREHRHMTGGPELRTERLRLRRWRPDDREPFAALNADPVVMEFFPALLSRRQSDAFIDRAEAAFDRRGYGFWAVEVVGGPPFIGLVGLGWADLDAPFAPAVEVGWRLDRPYWGSGYATEGATAALDHGFAHTDADEIVAFTALVNERSQRVMERLGMTRDPADDFEHPGVVPDHLIGHHVLYRMPHARWEAWRGSGA